MRLRSAEDYMLRVLLAAVLYTTIDSQYCSYPPPFDIINQQFISALKLPNRVYVQYLHCNESISLFSLLISIPQNYVSNSLLTPELTDKCLLHLRNVSVVLHVFLNGQSNNETVWTMLKSRKQNICCRDIDPPFSPCNNNDFLNNTLKCESDFDWFQPNNSVIYEYYPLKKSDATIPTTTSSISTRFTSSTSHTEPQNCSNSTPDLYSGSSTSYPVSDLKTTSSSSISGTESSYKFEQMLGLGLGLGIPLLIAIIIIIVLSIQLSLAKREKRDKPDAYSTISPNSGNSSPSGATQEPQLSADYSSISPNSTIDKSTFNRKTLYAPSSTYDQPYANGNYASISTANGNTPSPQQKQTAPSVLYAIVNKVKPKRNPSKASRTLANPNDDVVIVDNDLYTSDSVVSK